MNPYVQASLERLEEIELHSSVDNGVEISVQKAVATRTIRILKNQALTEEEDSELKTRLYLIKEAHRKLEGELRAFARATERHDKG